MVVHRTFYRRLCLSVSMDERTEREILESQSVSCTGVYGYGLCGSGIGRVSFIPTGNCFYFRIAFPN